MQEIWRFGVNRLRGWSLTMYSFIQIIELKSLSNIKEKTS